MKSKLISFFLLISLLPMAGCLTTGYAPAGQNPMGAMGGFRDEQAERNIFVVSFSGNGFTSQGTAVELALLRASELALKNGYPYFVIVKGDGLGLSENKKGDNPKTGTNYKTNWGSAGLVTAGFREIPELFDDYYDSAKVFEHLKTKHNLDLQVTLQPYDDDSVELEMEVDPLYKDLPPISTDEVKVKWGFVEMSSQGIPIANYHDVEDPLSNRIVATGKWKDVAAKIGADCIVLEDSPANLRQFGYGEYISFAAIAYLFPDAVLGLQWEPSDFAQKKYIIRRFDPDGKGKNAGLLIGDRVLEINRIDLINLLDHYKDWLTWKPYDKVKLTIVRNGEEKEIELEVIPNM